MQQQQQLHLVGYAVPNYTVVPGKLAGAPGTQKVDFTIPIAVSVFVYCCFCPILGLAAFVIAIAGFTREPDSNSERLRRASLYVSLAGYLCGIILISIILIVAFAHKGSDIYVRPPGEESGKFWISQA